MKNILAADNVLDDFDGGGEFSDQIRVQGPGDAGLNSEMDILLFTGAHA